MGSLKAELVVARYRENVDWVLDSPYPVTVYNKGKPLDFDSPNVDVINLKNVGREAHTWLSHICNNYDDLALWTFFLQGKPHLPIDVLWERLRLPFENTTPLVLEYLSYFPDQAVKDRDRVETLAEHEIRWGDANFHGNRKPEENKDWLASIWANLFTRTQPDPWWFGYCSSYCVRRDRITDRPLKFWLWLKDVVEVQGNVLEQTPLSPWGLELAWNYLWGDALLYPVRSIPQPPPQLPGVLAMAKNFVSSATTQLLAGNPTASPEVQAKRRSICNACPQYLAEQDRCKACGCWLASKISWQTTRCPLSLW